MQKKYVEMLLQARTTAKETLYMKKYQVTYE
jgi:hypothetical protein